MSALSLGTLRRRVRAPQSEGAESPARWHGERCQLSLASAHLPLQPGECSSLPLLWQSRHSQTGRMCGGERVRRGRKAVTETEVV